MPAPPPQPEPAHRRASSSTCSTAPARRSIGCMAGLLRLIAPYHRSHHRKRLIAKLNAAPQAASAPPSQPSSPTKTKTAAAAAASAPSPVKKTTQQQQPAPVAVRRRRSCDAPRSPTIAPEHRRSSCDSPRPPPPAIVARLMGLEESAPPSPAAGAAAAPRRPVVVVPTRPPPPPPPAAAAPETAAEKRRKLLGALEKCDEDLKTLRRIIAAVRAAEMRAADVASPVVAATTTPPAAAKGGANKWTVVGRDERQSPSPSPSPPLSSKQYPSPDSVLDAISSPRFPCRKRPSPCCTDTDAGGDKAGCGNGAVAPTVGSKIVKPSRTLVFSGDYRKIRSGDELHAAVHYPAVPVPVGMPRSAGAESWRHHRRRWELEAAAAGRVMSRATLESAREAMWGPQGHNDEQSRERGRVAAALEVAITQDLVADLLADLLVAQSGHGGRAGCRKRLCF